MDDLQDSYQRLGEALFEEIVVRAGLDQARTAGHAAVPVALNIVVEADASGGRLVIRGERVGQAPLEVRVNVA